MSDSPQSSFSVLPSETEEIFSILDYFYRWEKEKPQDIYLKQPIGKKYQNYTWAKVGQEARKIVSALRDMGFEAGTHIGLSSKNCAHWIICDIALKIGGYVSVPFYPNLSAPQLRQILTHSDCKVLFVGKLDDLQAVNEGVPEGIVRISFPISEAEGFIKWDDLLEKYEPFAESPRPDPHQLETITYTSGTTGIPKGVMSSFYTGAVGIRPTLPITKLDKEPGRFFSYLPLNHAAERGVVEAGSLINGGTIYFVESQETFAQNLKSTRPHYFMAVPRVWTKFQMGVLANLPQEKLDHLLSIPILSSFIKKKIRKALGLNNLRLAFSGAAPISASLLDWFDKLGITILEGYGMTENNAICTVTIPGDREIGTVGKPYDASELKIDPKTSEILMKAPWNMLGYYKNPELTAQTLVDGWLHTGDMGTFTEAGNLKITGRVKDMFKTAKGEYVLPVPMERMLAANTFIEQVCVIGLGQPQPFAFVNLSEKAQKIDQKAISKSLAHTLEEVNAQVADYEHLHKIIVCQTQWTVESGILTPTLKIKRQLLEAKYQPLMEKWYNKGEGKVIFE